MTITHRPQADQPRLSQLFAPIDFRRPDRSPTIAQALANSGQIRRPAQSVAGQA